eukprot:TRINITY_DN11234_c0_g1_i1.p1 TRINITY_DN11234_c0_g1~~TRINITY_DN11234_c0_g1_i1.p1  ORF type:complete len:571 (+),score=87.53 TRINITY_DN11234_c0_g1_i1:71-1783(+)
MEAEEKEFHQYTKDSHGEASSKDTEASIGRPTTREIMIRKAEELVAKMQTKHANSSSSSPQKNEADYQHMIGKLLETVPENMEYPKSKKLVKKREGYIDWACFMKETKSVELKKESLKLTLSSPLSSRPRSGLSITASPSTLNTGRSFRQHTASDLNTTTQSQSKILDEIKIEKRTSLVKLIAVPTPKIRIQTSFDERDFDVQKELAIPKSPEKKQIPMIPAGSIHYLLSLEDAASKRDEDYPVELPGAKRRMKSLKSFRKTGSFHTKSPQLRFNIKFGKAVKKSWDQLKKDRNGAVPEDEYYRFVRSLVRPLLGDSVTGLELKLSKIDWLHDTKNQNHLDYQAFHEITYLVTDLWSDGIEIDDYLGFLTRISSHYQTLFNEKIATTSPTRSVVVVESDYYLRSKFRAESERRQALEQEAARAEYTYLKHRGLGIVQPDIKGYQSSLVSLPSSYLPSTKINYQFYESFTPKTVINRTLPHLPALDCGASVKLADQGYTEPSANQSDFSEVASSSPDRPGRLSPDRIKNYQQEYLLKLSSLETTAPQSQDLQVDVGVRCEEMKFDKNMCLN